MRSLEREEREGRDCEVIHIFNFLEPPEMEGIGSSPAPAIGEDEPEPEPEEDVWFAEAAEQTPPEAATVVVPEDMIREAFESGEWKVGSEAYPLSRSDHGEPWMQPCSQKIANDDLEPETGDQDDLRLYSRSHWRVRATSMVSPLAMISSVLAIVLSVTALATRQETTARDQAVERVPATVFMLPAIDLNGGDLLDGSALDAAEKEPVDEPSASGFEAVVDQRPARRAGRAIRAPTASAQESIGVPAARFLRNGRIWFDRGRYRTALVWYARAAELAPGEPRAQFGVALAAFELGDDELAEKTLEAAIEAHPEHADSHLLLGFLHQSAGVRGAAVEHYRLYLSSSPDGEWAEELRAVVSRLDR